MLDNGGLALTFAYHKGKISPKAGIIKSLQIPNSTIPNTYNTHAPLSQIFIYSVNPNRNKTTPVLALRLVAVTIPTSTIINIHNGSTMTGGSR